jgi:hypothetical protein
MHGPGFSATISVFEWNEMNNNHLDINLLLQQVKLKCNTFHRAHFDDTHSRLRQPKQQKPVSCRVANERCRIWMTFWNILMV